MEGVSFLGEGNSVPGGAQTSRPGNPSPEKRFTGRICSLPTIRFQENALGTLGGAGGRAAPRAPGHPLTWGAGGLTCPQIAGARLPWRALSERRVQALLFRSAWTSRRVGQAGLGGSAPLGAPRAESGAPAAPGRSLGPRGARTRTPGPGLPSLHPNTRVPSTAHPSVTELCKGE